MNRFVRMEMLLGKQALETLKNAHVAVFGIGGVGSYTAEALARGGIGKITLIDGDTVAESNINRQLIATEKTIGMYKAEVMRQRINEINSAAEIHAYNCFYNAESADDFDLSQFSYTADAIDTVTSKLILIERAKNANVPVISCMGAGNKLDPTLFETADIYKTSVCPLARIMRKELKERGIDALKVVYSKEIPLKPVKESDYEENKGRMAPGSVSFVPSVAGLIMAGEIIKDLLSEQPVVCRMGRETAE